MQQKIIERNKFARFDPCSSLSLSVVSRPVVDFFFDAVNPFRVVKGVYIYFLSFTKRWLF